jgi:ParB family chromosome partitioning protein
VSELAGVDADEILQQLLDDDTQVPSREAPEFHREFPIAGVRPADYNPRFLSEEAFERLQASLKRFGVVKPVILNANGTIIAGHQRTRALTAIGVTRVPAMQLPVTIKSVEEIRFNLMHNSIEESGAVAYGPAGLEDYVWLEPGQLTVTDMGTAMVRIAACAKLLSVYGAWGSVVIDPASGRVLLNSDYAVACTRLRLPVLGYYPSAQDATPLREALAGEYGIYDTTQVVAKPYVQNVVQPNRLRDPRRRGVAMHKSRVWDNLSRPRMTKATRVLDFGAGKMDYVKHLAADGYDVRAYEPFITTEAADGSRALDIAQVVKQILRLNREVRRDGLFDLITLDSVLNATSTDEYRDAVLLTCAGLLKPGGLLCLGTRSLAAQEDMMGAGRKSGYGTSLTYLDPRTNRAINFRNGQFYAMWFATTDSLTDACGQAFDVVHVEDTRNATILAVCADPKPMSEERLRWALELELDMPYPGAYRHGKHGPLVEAIVEANRALGRLL